MATWSRLPARLPRQWRRYQAAATAATVLSGCGAGPGTVTSSAPAGSSATATSGKRATVTPGSPATARTEALPSCLTGKPVGAASRYLAGSEEVGDAGMVHAVAPGAAIAIILLPRGQATADFTQMLNLAATLGGVVSFSGGLAEHCFTAAEVSQANSALQADRNQHVTMIAGSGDLGAASIPYTGMAWIPYVGGKTLTGPAGSTSASAPFWAGMIALAGQYAGRHLGFVNPASYRIGRSPAYHRAFHDITTGHNTVTYPGGTITGYQAGPGWDPVTGWGSPDAQVLVPLLASGG